MKSENIVKKLEKEGYKIVYKKWEYWDDIPHVVLDGFDFAIVEHVYLENGWQGCLVDFIYNHVQEALYVAKKNNPIFFKKIKEVPWEGWYYGSYLILSMEDYFNYKKGIYPFNGYYKELERLKNQLYR